nr:DUF1918 domain-containing protein [Mycolicibacterium malmesburyense]CRL75791.1 hypothetical protein CPGR_03703 [Mycolicibacterium malmesburyense]
MKAKAGDWYVVQGRTSGRPERRGMIIRTHGVNGAAPFDVRWLDNGYVETVSPDSDAVIVTAAEQVAADHHTDGQ